MKRNITDFYGRVIGSIEEGKDENIAKDFYGRVLGKYDRKLDVTKDFYGRILAKGDILASLIWEGAKK